MVALAAPPESSAGSRFVFRTQRIDHGAQFDQAVEPELFEAGGNLRASRQSANQSPPAVVAWHWSHPMFMEISVRRRRNAVAFARTDCVVGRCRSADFSRLRIGSNKFKRRLNMARQDRQSKVQGEGDYEATRRYRKRTKEYLQNNDVEKAALRAAPKTRREAESMNGRGSGRQASRQGRGSGVTPPQRAARRAINARQDFASLNKWGQFLFFRWPGSAKIGMSPFTRRTCAVPGRWGRELPRPACGHSRLPHRARHWPSPSRPRPGRTTSGSRRDCPT